MDVGSTRVPMLSNTAIWPASKIGSKGESCGATAYCRPPPNAVAGFSSVLASAARAVAMTGRCAEYSAWLAASYGTRVLA